MVKRPAILLVLMVAFAFTTHGDERNPFEPNGGSGSLASRNPRLGLWLAKKDELLEHKSAAYDLVMTAWFEPAEATDIRNRHPSVKLLAGLTLNWISSNPEWQTFLVTVANGGDPNGPLQITDDMFLMYDDDGDGNLDRRCRLPGWDNPEIYAMDPRHSRWQELIQSFYNVVAAQPQHDGIIVDMVDAYSFCEGSRSAGVPAPLDSSAWVAGQEHLLSMLRDSIPAEQWIIANAGRDFPEDSPFPQYLNGYVLENALGTQFGLGLEELLASAQRALDNTVAPHVVIFAVDTDDSGKIDWPRFRTGLVASLLMDHSYFAFDFGPRNHGGVKDYWFPDYYEVVLGEPLAAYYVADGAYRRDFEQGVIVAAVRETVAVSLSASHVDVATGMTGTDFTIPQGDARIFLREGGVGIADHSNSTPRIFSLNQNYPNPFAPSTTVRFGLPAPVNLTLTVYNSLGQEVRTLASGKYASGKHEITWDGRDDNGKKLASGVYLLAMRAGEAVLTRKIILMNEVLMIRYRR